MKTNNYLTTARQQLFRRAETSSGSPQRQRRRTKPWRTSPLLMAMLALLWFVPQGAAAISGSGTSSDPYTIANLADLNAFRNRVESKNDPTIAVGKYWKVTANIDARDVTWDPIGNGSGNGEFQGIFDGGGKTIRIGSIYNMTTQDYVGFFSTVRNATIRNLNLEFGYFDCRNFVGGLIGESAGTVTVEYVHVNQTSYSNVYGYGFGGIVGKVYQGTLNLTGCSFTNGNLRGTRNGELYAGGLVGAVESSTLNITDCMAQASLSRLYSSNSSARWMAGLVGGLYNNSTATLIRVVQIGTVESFTGSASIVGYIGSGSSFTVKKAYTSTTTYAATNNGLFGQSGIVSGTSDWLNIGNRPYILERTDNNSSTKGASTRGNERWGYYDTSRPQVTTGAYAGEYAVKVTKGSGISSISGNTLTIGSDYYLNAKKELTVTSTFSPSTHQRVDYLFASDYGSSANTSYIASKSGHNWRLTPYVNGTVSASLTNIPYPYGLSTKFDQWTSLSKLTLSGSYNNPQGLPGKLYIYKRTGGSGGWALETDGVTVSSGTNMTFSKDITLAAADLDKSWEYYVVFVEGNAPAPSDPTGSAIIHKAVTTGSTVVEVDLTDFVVNSRQADAELKFKVDNRLINSPGFTYAIQSRLKGSGANFVNWKEEQRFDGRNGYYTEIDSRMASACDIYEYRLVVNAFNRTFTSPIKEGGKTSSTRFDTSQPFKASKGEYANYVRLQWKVAKDEAGAMETFRVFRRVANTKDEFTELETVTSTSPTVYWSDNNALTGVYYEYLVKLYQVCSGVETATSEEPKDVGFTQAFGTVSGRVTYGTGTSVPDVQMLVKRNELQEGESQYRSLKSPGGGQAFQWADEAKFAPVYNADNWTYQFWINPDGTNTGEEVDTKSVIIGTDMDTDYSFPYSTYYRYSYTQQIYDADELGLSAGDKISTISFQYVHTTPINNTAVVLYLGNTSQSEFTSNADWVPFADLTKVFDGTVLFDNTGEDNWVTITFDTPFTYTGQNIVLGFDNNLGTYPTDSHPTFRITNVGRNKSKSAFTDEAALNPDPTNPPTQGINSDLRMNRYNYRSNAKFNAVGKGTVGNIGDLKLHLDKEGEGYRLRTSASSTQSAVIPAKRFTHVALTRSGNTISMLTVNDQNPDSVYTEKVSFTYEGAALTSANANISLGKSLKGNIDDIRLWKRALTETELMKNYNRYIVGNENGLTGYWTLDEGLAGYAFDRSRVGTVYNGNHATSNSLTIDTNIPENSQLAIKGITDSDGNYQVTGIPYAGEGTSYSIVPTLGVHKFNPTQQLRYISPSSMVHNATDFTDISSFKVSGVITYAGGNYPVDGCSFEIDDKAVTLSNGAPYVSDRNGEFTISVPIGVHKVRVVKQGHVFANDGLLQNDGENINYNKPLSGIKFFDQTKVKLIGRVTGGLAENDKELGFGESNNNIGAGKITLESTRKEYKFVTDEQRDTVLHNSGEWKKPNGLAQDTTYMSIKEKEIDITVSPVTGEFVAWVYPEPYNILEIKVKGDNNTQVTIYDKNEMIDLSKAAVPDNSYMKTSVRTWTDSVFVSKPGMVDHYEKVEKSDTIKYHAEWKHYYQATPTFSALQLNGKETLDYLGEKSIDISDDLTGLNETITLWDNTGGYLFGNPVFKQGSKYQFKLQAYEQYVNYTATPAATTTYPVRGGVVNMTNNVRISPQPEQIELDSLGLAVYSFMAGAPDLTTAQNNIFATVQIGNLSYYWNRGTTPVNVWHLGDRTTGTDFMTSGPDELTTILRDPPGSNSYAFIEKGTSYTKTTKNSVVNSAKESLNTTFELGAKLATFVGLGAGVITENEVTNEIAVGVEASQQWTNETENTTTTTFTERFETSSDPLYVGHLGDVFVGNSTNIQYGLTNGVNIQKGTVEDAWTTASGYSIAKSASLAYGQTFATRFAYTQVELEEIMIPKWEQSIVMLLKPKGTAVNPALITEPVYVSKLDANETGFGKINGGSNPYDGNSYQIVFPSTWKSGNSFSTLGFEKMKTFQDSIIWANNQIGTWKKVLERNEKEKVEMTHLGNYSFGSGASIEYNTTKSVSKSETNDFTWVVSPSFGLETGFKVAGVGVKVELELEYSHEGSSSETTANENSVSSGFVLAEEGDDDQITVDYGMTKTGTIAFKSRGGRTSCPYEGEVKSKYYEPGRHILSEATMQIEVPKIDVAGASSVLNVPANKTASFVLDLKNESETDEDIWFELIVDEATNPHGAELKIDGGIIGNGRLFLVKAGEVLKKTLTIGKGTADKYDNIGLILRSQCQHDPTDFLPDIADTTYVSVEFIPGCSDVRIKEPSDKWIMNRHHETGDTLYVTIDNYDVNYPNFGYIRLEQRLASEPSWSTITTFYPSHLYAEAQGMKEDIATRSAIVYPWKMPSVDGAYELRATVYSVNSSDGRIIGNPLSSYATAALSGYKDMLPPTSLGAPSPASGILGAADELSITFNEDIQTGMLTKYNFGISGVLNEQPIAEPNVGLAFDGTGKAQTELPIYTDASFSIETWFNRKPNTAGTLFSYGSNDNYLSLGFNAAGKAELKAGSQTFTSVDAIANDDTWKYIALSYDREKNQVAVYEFEGANSKILFTAAALAENPAEQGKLYVGSEATGTTGFQGAIAHLHFYSSARTQAAVSLDKSLTKTGKERNLIGYWNLEDGEGTVAKDKARSRDLSLNTGWYIYPSGRAVTLDGSKYVSLPVSTYPLDVFSDLTLEFWFKGSSQSDKTLFSADNNVIGFDADEQLVLYKSDGTVNQKLTSKNLLDNEWHHFALSVKRNGTTNAYIDGQSTAAFSSSEIASFASANYYFGAKRATDNTFSQYFTGTVDEIRIWNSALTRNVILLNKNSKLAGNEVGLLAYYPFETYNKQESGLVSVTTSKANGVDNSMETGGNASIGTNAVAVKDVRPVENVPFTYVASNNKIVFTLDENYFSRVEGTMLNITASDIYDMRNNKSDTESWTAYVNRNALLWDSEAIKLSMEEGTTQSFTAKIANKGGSTLSYAINNLPNWLQVNSSIGNLAPLASKELTFTVSKGINVGNYEASIELSSGKGVNEILPVQLKVTGERPDWSVNPFDYESTMNITGSIQIMGINQEDEDDLLAAFIGETCVGVTLPKYVPEYNAYFTFMNVYGNSEHVGKPIILKLWDASTGNIYPVVESSLNNLVENLTFTANGIKGNSNTPVIHNAQDIVQQSIDLAAGWNWISFNVESSSPTLLQQFIDRSGSLSNILKSQNDGYVQAPNWVGGLSALNAKNMYLAQTTAAHSVLVNGKIVKPASTPIDIVANGWTWIGYTPQFTLPISSALAGLNPQMGDQIKGHTGFRTYMGSNGWIGNLDYMRPGEGYMFYSTGNSPQQLVYPNATSQFYKMKQADGSEIEKHWQSNVHKYPNNMTITGYVELDGVPAHSDQIEIAAFAGDECRGSVLLTDYSHYSDLPQSFMIFLTICGNETEEIHFKAYSHEEEKEYVVSNEAITYATNRVIGDPINPYKFTLSRLSTGLDNTKLNFEIYPNPVQNILYIKHAFNKIDEIEISDVSGRVLFREYDFEQSKINVSSLPDGMYLFKMTVNNERYVQKFMKK